MVTSGRDSANNTHPETADDERTPAESVGEESDKYEATEQEEIEDIDDLSSDTTSTGFTVTGAATVGVAGLTTESARRIGVDRYAEAGFAERAYAKAYAEEIGGTVVEDGASVFTPDGGVDRVIQTASSERRLQSKHHAEPLGSSVLSEYADEVDVVATTNGVAESADPEAYDLDVITIDDLSWKARAKLEADRVVRGCKKGLSALKRGIQAAGSLLIRGTKFAVRKIATGGKWLGRRLVKIGGIAAAWFTRRSLTTQIALVVTGAGLLYFLWKWYQRRKDDVDDQATTNEA